MRRAAVITVTVVSLFSLFQIVTVAQGLRGEAVEHTVTVDGITREYLVFASKGFDKPLFNGFSPALNRDQGTGISKLLIFPSIS